MDLGFVRVAAAVPVVKVADCEFNAENIGAMVERAAAGGAGLVVFPELSITGYTCGDLLANGLLIEKAEQSLERLCARSSHLDIISIVGAPVRYKSKLYNCGVVFCRGKILGIVPKTHLPNYEEFYEARWFAGAGEPDGCAVIDYGGQVGIPFGCNLIFGDDRTKIAVEICEDLWTPCPPSSFHALAGAHIVANLSASDELAGKNDYIRSLVSQQSARTVSSYVYASAGFGESSTDLVFAGNGLVAENGRTIAAGERFSYEGSLTVCETDVQALEHARTKLNTFTGPQPAHPYRIIEVAVKQADWESPFSRTFDPHPFIPDGGKDRDERCSEIFNIQVMGLAKRLLHTGAKTAVVGVSGGGSIRPWHSSLRREPSTAWEWTATES